MLFLLSGSSGSGKSSALQLLEREVTDLAILDLDAVMPDPDDPYFWNRAVERGVRRALEAEEAARDAILAGWTPLGELLAAPSAIKLNGIAVCHLDCDDAKRVERLTKRARDWGHPPEERLDEIVGFSRWLRRHYADPGWERPKRRPNAWPEMRWERWATWERGDPRWSIQRIDTTELSVSEVVNHLKSWIGEQRNLLRSGALPLSGRWWNG